MTDRPLDRRGFIKSATLVAGTAAATAGLVNDAKAEAPSGASATRATASRHGGPMTRRWTEQRWLLDNTIRAVGMDWDQPRPIYLSAPCGPEASADFAYVEATGRIVKTPL